MSDASHELEKTPQTAACCAGGDWIARGMFLCGIALVAFVAGIVISVKQAPPYAVVRDACLALSAFGEQRDLLASEWPVNSWMPAATEDQGLVTHESSRTSGDYTLYTSAHSDNVVLLDMHGNEAYRWDASFGKVRQQLSKVPSWLPDHFVYIRRAHAYPNGDLLTLYETTANTPSGCGLARFDRTGKVLWTLDESAHHDYCLDQSGRIFVLTQQVRRLTEQDTNQAWLRKMPLIEDTLTIVSSDGQTEKTFSLLKALLASDYFLLHSCHLDSYGDITHNNTVDLVGPGFAARHEGVSPGDLMVCLRNLNLVAVVNPESEELVWATTGPWNHPHDPDPLENGNLLIFDNLLVRGQTTGAGVIEFDPLERKIVRTYDGDSRGRFHSDIRACQQLLANGNLLITESDRGRLIEIDPAGETVWEFVNPVRGGNHGELIPVVCGGRRYDRQQLPFLQSNPTLARTSN